MRFVVFVQLTGASAADYEAGRMPTQPEIARMMHFNQEAAEAGVLLDGGGLHPPATAIRIEFGESGPHVIDGPFAEAKEVIGGYWLWQTASREEAIAWARRCPMQPGDVLVLRQLFEEDDFGEALGPDERAIWHDVEATSENLRNSPQR